MNLRVSKQATIPRLRKGDMVKVVWHDAVEGLGGPSVGDLDQSTLHQLVTASVVTIGRYLRSIGAYMVLSEVIREESEVSIFYERHAQGKWLAIPMNVISQMIPLGNIDPYLIGEVRRRRTIFKQLRFIPRSKRLPNGKISRTLYVN